MSLKKAKAKLNKRINELEAKVEKLEKEYEEAIKNGNFEMESPYPEIIKIYDVIMQEVVDSDAWGFDMDCNYQYVEASYYRIQKKYKEKYEEDKKLREIQE